MPLVLELLRHGEAFPAGAAGDAARRLSRNGARALERLASRLAAERWYPDRVFTSPLLRASDSARIALEPCMPPIEPEVLDELATALSPERLVSVLEELGATAGRVLLVGHQPLIGNLALYLEDGKERKIPPGSFLRFECPEGLRAGRCRMVWQWRPGDPS